MVTKFGKGFAGGIERRQQACTAQVSLQALKRGVEGGLSHTPTLPVLNRTLF